MAEKTFADLIPDVPLGNKEEAERALFENFKILLDGLRAKAGVSVTFTSQDGRKFTITNGVLTTVF